MKRYIDEFIHRYKCAGDMIALGLFPNGKEITESMAVFRAVKEHVLEDKALFGNPNITLVSVGDGTTPRTAALFAFMTNWTCVSVDPRLNNKDWSVIQRLNLYQDKIENLDLDYGAGRTVIVNVHSHAPLKSVLEHINAARRDLVALECCVPMTIPNVPFIGYNDTQIWSPMNLIKIWKNI